MICCLTVPGMTQTAGPVPGPGPAQGGQVPVQGQPPGPQMANGHYLEAMKIAFLTRRLNISPDEAQRFWPVYYQYAAENRQAHAAYRVHKNELLLDEALLNIKKKYSPAFARALGPDRANEFFRADKDFGAIVQKEMQRRQQNQVQPRKPLAGEK